MSSYEVFVLPLTVYYPTLCRPKPVRKGVTAIVAFLSEPYEMINMFEMILRRD